MNENLNDQTPKSIGRYEVQDGIGFGAMGAVYKAFDPLIKRTLAIKTIRLDIPRQSPEYKTFIERFYHEARISGTLSHPNIVTLFDIGEDASGTPYLAMEFVEGETIESSIESGSKFQPEKVVGLISQVAAALDYAHARGVIHRDIKPANLILFEGDRVKVMDFGVAKLAGAHMTQAGQLLGTPSYMSPEQAMGEDLDGRSDIFSLGVCAFEMLSGEQPFPGNNVTSILYKLVHMDPVEPPNLEMNGLVPQKWHEVFGKVLAKKAENRYQTGAEFVQDLEYCLGSWFGAAMGDQELPDKLASTEPMPVGALTVKPQLDATRPNADIRVQEAETAEVPTPAFAVKAEQAPATELQQQPPQESEEETPPTEMLPTDAGEEATALMDREELPPTVMQAAPNFAADTLPPSAATPSTATQPRPLGVGEEEAGATVVLGQDQLGATPPEAPPPTMQAAAPTAQVPGSVVPPTKPKLPLGLILGAAGLFLAATLVGVGLLVFGGGEEEAPPATTATPEPTPEPASMVAGMLHIESEPAGAAVTINGEERGTTPLDVTGLGPGEYEVLLELRRHRPHTETVVLTEEQPTQDLELTLKAIPRKPATPTTGKADIRTTPPGAVVTIAGKEIGKSPIAGHRLRPGKHAVRITLEGHEPFEGTLTIAVGKAASLSADLVPIPPEPTPTPEPEVDVDRIYGEREVDTPPKKVTGKSYKGPKLKPGERVSVVVQWVVTEEGKVTDVTIEESGGAQLDEAIADTLKKWRYRPGVKAGVRVKVRLTRKYTYRRPD